MEKLIVSIWFELNGKVQSAVMQLIPWSRQVATFVSTQLLAVCGIRVRVLMQNTNWDVRFPVGA